MPQPISEEKRIDWQERVLLQKESGQTMSRWCREQQVDYNSFLYWKDKLHPAEKTLKRSSFQELTAPLGTTGVSIEYKEVRIILEKRFDAMVLAQCLQVLKGVSC